MSGDGWKLAANVSCLNFFKQNVYPEAVDSLDLAFAAFKAGGHVTSEQALPHYLREMKYKVNNHGKYND